MTTYPVFQAWLQSLPAGPVWAKANVYNNLSDVFTPYGKRPAFQYDPTGILRSWGCSAYDHDNGYLLVFGMGHATGCGNDGYYFSTRDMMWHRGWLPSDMQIKAGWQQQLPKDSPVSPNAAHLYDHMLYLPVLKKVISFGGNGWIFQPGYAAGPYVKYGTTPDQILQTGPYTIDLNLVDPNKVGGTTGSGVDVNDFGANVFANRDNMSGTYSNYGQGALDVRAELVNGVLKDVVYTLGSQAGGIGYGMRIVIDPASPSADTYTTVVSNANVSTGTFNPNRVGCIVPGRNVHVTTADVAQGIAYYTLDGYQGVSVPTTSQSLPITATLCGLAGDPVRNKVVLWGGNRTVYEYDVPAVRTNTWTLTAVDPSIAPSGAPPGLVTSGTDPACLLGGILGKWQYLKDYDVFAGILNNTEGQVWVYKPANWAPTWSGQSISAAVSVPAVAFLGQF